MHQNHFMLLYVSKVGISVKEMCTFNFHTAYPNIDHLTAGRDIMKLRHIIKWLKNAPNTIQIMVALSIQIREGIL